MCISGKMFGSSKKSSAPAKPKTEEVKKKATTTLLNGGGKDGPRTPSPRTSVGYAGRGGFDSFGNTSSKGSDPRGRM